jgi:hypothetical protein
MVNGFGQLFVATTVSQVGSQISLLVLALVAVLDKYGWKRLLVPGQNMASSCSQCR